MDIFKTNNPIIAIIGLGYVGLPVACEFSKHYPVIGFDINSERIFEIINEIDNTLMVCLNDFNENELRWTDNQLDLKDASFYIVTVPTPVDVNNKPDLFFLKEASRIVGQSLKKGNVVVFESTVYPGTTEEICKPILEEFSNLKEGSDFYLGYSPERINPGDNKNTLLSIDKIVSCSSELGLSFIVDIYEKIYKKKIHTTSNIKAAEAAKIIENTQRDVNIAFMNEIHELLRTVNIDTYEVIQLASTKWNFANYSPGLVGGHCISVDPYYLIDYGIRNGIDLQLIKSSRKINAEKISKIYSYIEIFCERQKISEPVVTFLGITYKENCSDTRNSQSLKLAKLLSEKGYNIQINDNYLYYNKKDTSSDMLLHKDLCSLSKCHILVMSVAHDEYIDLEYTILKSIMFKDGVIIDIKNIINKQTEINLKKININVWKG